jgi:hypothetical protein
MPNVFRDLDGQLPGGFEALLVSQAPPELN